MLFNKNVSRLPIDNAATKLVIASRNTGRGEGGGGVILSWGKVVTVLHVIYNVQDEGSKWWEWGI